MPAAFAHTVAVAAVEFQHDVRVWGALPEALTAFLRTEAFPMSAPPALRSTPDYGGLKLFPYDARYLCLARFFDAGQTDAYRRAIPSAVVLVFDAALFQRGFRNLPALDAFLTAARDDPRTLDTYEATLAALYADADVTDSAERFQAFVAGQEIAYERAAAALGLLLASGRLTLCGPTRAHGRTGLAVLYAMAPPELVRATRWCTYAATLDVPHEEVLCYPCQLPPPTPPTWRDRLAGLFARADAGADVRFDLTSGGVEGAPARDARQQRATTLARELADNTLGLPGTFGQRFELFVGLLGALYTGADFDVDRRLRGALATDEIEKRLTHFLKHT